MADNPLTMALGKSLPRITEKVRSEKLEQKRKDIGASMASIFENAGTNDIEKTRDLADLFASEGMLDKSLELNQVASKTEYERETLKDQLDRKEGIDYLNAVSKVGLTMTTSSFVDAMKSGTFDPSKIESSDLVVKTKDGGKVFTSSGWVLDDEGKRVFTNGVQVYAPGSKQPVYVPNRDIQGKIVSAKQPLTVDARKSLYQTKSDIKMDEFWKKEKGAVTADFFNTYKKGINAERNKSISDLTEIDQAIKKAPDRVATFGIITSIIARQLGKEVGALSEGDLKRVAGNQSVPASLQRKWNKLTKGQTLNPGDIEDFRSFIADSISIQTDFMNNDAETFGLSRSLESEGALNAKFIQDNLKSQFKFDFTDTTTDKTKKSVIKPRTKTIAELTKLYEESTGKKPDESTIERLKKLATFEGTTFDEELIHLRKLQ